MKKLGLLFFLAVFSAGIAAQQGSTAPVLEPNDSMALFKVLVTNIEGVPYKGDVISFENKATGASFSGKAGANGKFDILLPKGQTYNVRVRIVGKDTTMRSIAVPSEPELITFEYTFKYRPPQTIKLDRVYFDTNKSTLKAESYQMLNDLFEFLSNKPAINIEIAGHTDNVGGEAFNMKLSQDRANSVKAYLVKKGIVATRLTPVGYGFKRPIATNDTPEGRQMNRRTEVYVVEK